MQRPIMDPTFMNDHEPVAKQKQRKLWALAKAVMKLGKILLIDPFSRPQRLRIEDGRPWQRFVRGFIYRLALVPVLLVIFLTLLVLAATHPGRTTVGADPLAYGMYFDPISFLAEDNVKVEGWLVPAVDARRVIEEGEATLQKKYPAMVLVHDFAASRQQLLPLVRPLHDRGFVVLVLALRGSGALTSDAQTFGLNEALDVKAAVEMLRRRAFVDASKIGVLGTGTGANAALLAARKDPGIAALVISNPIDGFDEAFARRVGSDHKWLPPLRTLFRWTFSVMYSADTEDLRLKNFKELIATRPVLVMDSRRELMTPSSIRDVQTFLAARMALPEAMAASGN
ncbi:MAG TPA: prolyl oligopeptidase family serine peptidase [Tepidisphaeraceae bacterium]|jgi:hypothetical protein